MAPILAVIVFALIVAIRICFAKGHRGFGRAAVILPSAGRLIAVALMLWTFGMPDAAERGAKVRIGVLCTVAAIGVAMVVVPVVGAARRADPESVWAREGSLFRTPGQQRRGYRVT